MAHDIIMPALGMAQDTGIIVAWHKQPGDSVKSTDVLMEVETDKATVEVEAGHDGFLTAVRAETGVPVPVGEVVAVISDDKNAVEAPPVKKAEAPAVEAEAKTPEPESPPAAPAASEKNDTSPTPPAKPAPRPAMQSTGGRILASPKAKRLAKERGIDLGRMVRLGTRQPIHVSDLDKAGSTAGLNGATTSLMRINVDGTLFTEFLSWLADETGETADPQKVWAAFAAGSFRKASGLKDDADIVVQAILFFDEADALFVRNPDRTGLGEVTADTGGGEVALSVLDLTETSLAEYRPAGGTAYPQVSITRGSDGDSLDISLVFEPELLSAQTALIFLKDLASRAEQPLRHLL